MRKRTDARVILAGALVGLFLALPIAASAHTGSTFYTSGLWDSTTRKSVLFYTQSDVTGNFLSRILDGAKVWENTNQTLDFDRGGTNSKSLVCEERAANYSVVYKGTMDGAGGTLASTRVCRDPYTPSKIRNFNIKFDTAESWHTDTTTTVPSTKVDLQSAAAHEFGHATGWGAHFDDVNASDPVCANDSGQQTMCSKLSAGTARMRSLQSHDIDVFSQMY
jgi:hypothetical protein